MSRTFHDLDDEDDFEWIDGRRVLKDKHHFRVPMKAMDGLQRDEAEAARRRAEAQLKPRDSLQFPRPPRGHTLVVDSNGGTLNLHRPGFRLAAGGDGTARDHRTHDTTRLYAQRDAATEQEWQDPIGLDPDPVPGPQEGDRCTVRNAEYALDFGAPGHLQMSKGRLVCVPDAPRPRDAQSIRSARDRAYADYDKSISKDWKDNNGDFVGQRAGDLCTVDGSPGRLRANKRGDLVCVADHDPSRDARTVSERMQDHKLRMGEEYAAYTEQISNAWRNGK